MFITDVPIKPLKNKVSSFNLMSSGNTNTPEWNSFHNHTINGESEQK